jgi:hypothetical protein
MGLIQSAVDKNYKSGVLYDTNTYEDFIDLYECYKEMDARALKAEAFLTLYGNKIKKSIRIYEDLMIEVNKCVSSDLYLFYKNLKNLNNKKQ